MREIFWTDLVHLAEDNYTLNNLAYNSLQGIKMGLSIKEVMENILDESKILGDMKKTGKIFVDDDFKELSKTTTTIYVRLPIKILTKLRKKAVEEDRAITSMARLLIEQGLK
jgi:hypothetical protein